MKNIILQKKSQRKRMLKNVQKQKQQEGQERKTANN